MYIAISHLSSEHRNSIIFWIENNPGHILISENARYVISSKLIDEMTTEEIAGQMNVSRARVDTILRITIGKILDYIELKERADSLLYENPSMYTEEGGYPVKAVMIDPENTNVEKICSLLRTPVIDLFEEPRMQNISRNYKLIFIGDLIESKRDFFAMRNIGNSLVSIVEKKMNEWGIKWRRLDSAY